MVAEALRRIYERRMHMPGSRLLIVGGFLGAGKTSLLYRAAGLLNARGVRAGLITNDQAEGLVDTTFLEGCAEQVREVSGSCFCCNFGGFVDAVASIVGRNGDGAILAEPVGSCTDLSATLVQPLRDMYSDLAAIAPLTVLVDPTRLRAILEEADTPAAYIGQKQLDEADIILINKIDLLGADERGELERRAQARWPQARVAAVSARSGEGVEEWLDIALGSAEAGTHLADVDYERYAAGEAAYGWVNVSYELGGGCDFDRAARELLSGLEAGLGQRGASVGHVKFLLRAGGGQWLGNLTGGADAPSLRASESDAECGLLTINARAELSPSGLEEVVEQAVKAALGGLELKMVSSRSLTPGRPNPTYRYDSVAQGPRGVEDALRRAEAGEQLAREDALRLLAIPVGSREYYELLGIANRDARARFAGRGRVFAQIGINASPCPANCGFCSLAKDVFDPAGSFELPMAETERLARQLVEAGVDELFIMTTADFDRERFLEYAAAVKRQLPAGMRFVANVGDFDYEYALRLRQASFTGAYHIRRLREGVDTQLSPEQRIRTLDAIKQAGLELYYCVEPIGPEHSNKELVDEIFRARDYPVGVMAVMKRICVPGTRLYPRGEISAAELARACAVAELCVRPERAMGVHEPDELCLMAGANQIYAEVSVNPRDLSLQTEQGRGASVLRTEQLLRAAEWSI